MIKRVFVMASKNDFVLIKSRDFKKKKKIEVNFLLFTVIKNLFVKNFEALAFEFIVFRRKIIDFEKAIRNSFSF